MTLHLRQFCLVSETLEPAVDDLTAIFGINRCYVDPKVAQFGLENTLMTVGRNFLEVVAPVQENTTAGRYLERRGGSGGYMVITQVDTLANHQAVRQRALDAGVRVAFEHYQDGFNLYQLNPKDMVAGFLEIEYNEHQDMMGHWMAAGGTGWENTVKQDVTVDFLGAELQSEDPIGLAELWSQVIGAPVERRNSEPTISLNNVMLRFTETRDGRGAGIGGLDIAVANREAVLNEARARGCSVSEKVVEVCGTRFYLHDA